MRRACFSLYSYICCICLFIGNHITLTFFVIIIYSHHNVFAGEPHPQCWRAPPSTLASPTLNVGVSLLGVILQASSASNWTYIIPLLMRCPRRHLRPLLHVRNEGIGRTIESRLHNSCTVSHNSVHSFADLVLICTYLRLIRA